MPDITKWQDHLWARYCLLHLDDDSDRLADEDYDGELYPVQPPEPDVPLSPELSALIADFADRKRRAEQFREAFEAGNTELALAAIHPETLASPEKLGQMVELAKRMVPAPAKPERPWVPPSHWPDHPAADKDGMVSHGVQYEGSTGKTPLETIHSLFNEKARLLEQMANLEGRPGNIAAAESFPWNAAMQRVQAGIEATAKVLGWTSEAAHQAELHYTAAARRAIRQVEKTKQALESGRRPPGRVHAGWGFDYLGRVKVPGEEQAHPEVGGDFSPRKPAPDRPRRRHRRGRPAYRKSAILARQGRV